MNNNALKELPALDRTSYASKEAGAFEIYSARWVLSNKSLKGIKVPSFIEWPPEQKEAILRTLAQRATRFQPGSIEADISALKTFTNAFSKIDDFYETGINVENFITWLASKRHEEIKLKIRRIILAASELGYEKAFEEGVISLAKQYCGKRTRIHSERFESSRSFTEAERKQLYYQMARESHLGHLPLQVEMATSLILVTGKRPVQIAASKFVDFTQEEVSLSQNDRRTIIVYNVPIAKQKGQGFRSLFASMPITSSFDIWKNLEHLKEKNSIQLSTLLAIKLTKEQQLQLPVIMPSDHKDIINRFNKAQKEGLSLNEILKSDRLHVEASKVSKLTFELNNHISILSEYTGRPLTINARRFRHTRATHLALCGSSLEEIAYALDHSDNRTAMEYVDNLPSRAVKTGAQVDDTLGVLAKKFAGIDTKGSDKVISLYTKNGTHNVGVCGMESFCSENYPIACYECELFSPNPFGNHNAVQEYVETKIEEAKSFGDSRLLENWHTILLAVLERRYLADQQRLQMLNETPETLQLKHSGDSL